jgi:amino acid adenylation domain-containing protein
MQQQDLAFRSVCWLEINGKSSEESLSAALHQLTARHEILRTVYVHQAGMKFPFQAVMGADAPSVRVEDLSALEEVEQRAKIEEIFNLEQTVSHGPTEPPALAAILIKLGGQRHGVVLSVPAMTADAASLDLLGRELVQLIAAKGADDDDEPLRYVQFAQWQNDLIEGADEHSAKARAFWQDRSEDIPAVVLPFERTGAKEIAPQVVCQTLDATALQAVDALAVRLKVASSEVLLAAWQSLLWRLTGEPRFRIGVLFDFREYDELRGAVGLIAKNLPVEARFDGDLRFREVVDYVHASMAQAAEWQEYYSPGTGFGVAPPVNFEYRPSTSLCRAAVWNELQILKLCVTRKSNIAIADWQYESTRLTQATVKRLADYYKTLLGAALADSEAHVSRLPLLGDEERHQLLFGWNETTAEYPRDKCYHEMFAAQAAATPDRPALRCGDVLLTYRELDERSNQLAHYLRELGVGSDSLVGLCVERSAEMMVSVLGILKAGGAYVPLNPDNPKPRTAQQMAGVAVLITEQSLLANMPAFPGKTLCLDRDRRMWAKQSRGNLDNQTTAESRVYVIYTSGSTGVPKGVAVRHRNLVNYSRFIAQRLGLADHPEGLSFATVSTIGADLGNTCIYPALISGGCLHIIGHDVSTDAQRFAEYTARYPVDVLKIVPSHLQALLDSPYAAQVLPRKYLVMGGETFTTKLALDIYTLGGSCEVFNHYGPTETTVGSLTLRLADFDWKASDLSSIPIGRPIANTQIYILDALLRPVPAGVVGELYIAGDGVTAGYLNQAERTEDRFVRNPFAGVTTSRMYRTGDLARYLPNGNVEFLGRGDDQVKIRGFRIELGEIESVLAARPGVKQTVVLAKEDERGDKRLLAYVVADESLGNSPDELRAFLKVHLPEYMVPSAIVALLKIPLTPNGKIDRQALPEPETVTRRIYVAPKTATEEGVASIWQQVLRRERIGIDENFFDLGGHSLLATQVVSRVREQYRVELPIRAMFDHPTIEGLACAVEQAGSGARSQTEPAITRVSREAYRASVKQS